MLGFSYAYGVESVYDYDMTNTERPDGTPGYIAAATPGTRIAYVIQSVSFDSGAPVVTDTVVTTVVESITRAHNGNSPVIVWTDSNGDSHRNRPDFHVEILA